MASPRLSVIIPTHSRPELLPRAVESAFQAGRDVEVVVVDDASTDATAAICRSLPGIRYIRLERNQRVAGARNVGILASSAEYISFLDDDDWRLPDSFDAQLELLDSNPEAGMVYGKALFADQSGELLPASPTPVHCFEGDIFWTLMTRNVICCQTVIFRRSCLLKTGLLDATLHGVDDWDLWIRIAELFPVVAVKEPVAVWRKADPESNQGSSDLTNLLSLAISAHEKKWQRLPKFTSAPESLRKETMRQFYESTGGWILYDAAISFARGSFRRGASNLWQAFRCYPPYIARLYTLKLLTLSALSKAGLPRGDRLYVHEEWMG